MQPSEPEAAMTIRCPRCDSPHPKKHPAMQFEGEVQPCTHPWHTHSEHPNAQPGIGAQDHEGERNGFFAWVRANARVGGNSVEDGLTRGHIVEVASAAWKAAFAATSGPTYALHEADCSGKHLVDLEGSGECISHREWARWKAESAAPPVIPAESVITKSEGSALWDALHALHGLIRELAEGTDPGDIITEPVGYDDAGVRALMGSRDLLEGLIRRFAPWSHTDTAVSPVLGTSVPAAPAMTPPTDDEIMTEASRRWVRMQDAIDATLPHGYQLANIQPRAIAYLRHRAAHSLHAEAVHGAAAESCSDCKPMIAAAAALGYPESVKP